MSQKTEMTIEQKKIVGRDCPLFRASYPALDKPKQFEGKGDAEFSVTMLISKKDPKVALLKEKIRNAMIEKFGTDQKKWSISPSQPWWNPLRDGDQEKPDNPAYRGMYFVKAKAKEDKRPQVISSDGAAIEPSAIYPGCYCRASLIAYAYEFKGKRGSGFALKGIQFVRDGERLDNADVSGEFDSVEQTDGSEDAENYEEADAASGF